MQTCRVSQTTYSEIALKLYCSWFTRENKVVRVRQIIRLQKSQVYPALHAFISISKIIGNLPIFIFRFRWSECHSVHQHPQASIKSSRGLNFQPRSTNFVFKCFACCQMEQSLLFRLCFALTERTSRSRCFQVITEYRGKCSN